MSYSSCLADARGDLILDTSVIINLSASGVAAEVLGALPHRRWMVDMAAAEVRRDSRNGRSDVDVLSGLTAQGSVNIVTLDQAGLHVFESLVVALDDGEAATIAAAVRQQAVAVIDERKARRICAEEFPDIAHATSIDVFSHPAVVQILGANRLADAVHAALKQARMSVRPDQRDWIIELIGNERAAECSSIPGPRAGASNRNRRT
jgi:predicted nucleic acid-binding protein